MTQTLYIQKNWAHHGPWFMGQNIEIPLTWQFTNAKGLVWLIINDSPVNSWWQRWWWNYFLYWIIVHLKNPIYFSASKFLRIKNLIFLKLFFYIFVEYEISYVFTSFMTVQRKRFLYNQIKDMGNTDSFCSWSPFET